MKMIDFTHTKRPDFIQLVLIIAVACLALGAITPAASAIEYDDLSYSSGGTGGSSGSFTPPLGNVHLIDSPCSQQYEFPIPVNGGSGYHFTASEYFSSSDIVETYPWVSFSMSNAFHLITFNIPNANDAIRESYIRETVSYLLTSGLISGSTYLYVIPTAVDRFHVYYALSDDFVDFDISLQAFAPDDPAGMYVLSLEGSRLDTTYTVGINRYISEFKYLVDSYAYTDGSGSYTFTGSRSLTLPIYYNSFTNMPYSYEVSINVNDENGYLDERYLVYWSDLGGLYDTVPGPLVPTPTPTVTFVPPGPVVPSDIIPHPDDLNNTVNITGWYQDQGFEGNNITAPIYSGIRGWFNENLIPVIDFFLTPTNYVATVISDSSETSTSGISYITEELGSYAAPFNIVGGYVVLLVPEVVWIVVFAALSIGYVILLIKISTGSIRDTIGRFLGGSK